ncbi:MAG: hypothetical protein AAF492_16465, partial [Verrucomicrobiota bacterium]
MSKQPAPIYLCYDLKGIQSFIFAVPRLKCICGGSALMDLFDQHVKEWIEEHGISGVRRLFAGGGKGAFICDSNAAADAIQAVLVKKAHSDGISISFGRHVDYGEAAQAVDDHFPWLPFGDSLNGHPCAESGLYPVPKPGRHRMIERRIWKRGEGRIDRHFERQLLDTLELSFEKTAKLEFIHNLEADSREGPYASKALGGRNRWAIIAMDGNNLGAHHRRADALWRKDPERHTRWLSAMSEALNRCSHTACSLAIKRVLLEWKADERGRQEMLEATDDEEGTTWLPFRPLVVGGDDIILICHVRHALDFVREASRVFTATSLEEAAAARQNDDTGEMELWPAGDGSSTLSAGVLFAPVTLPLASAIPYAETLLASAKEKGRTLAREHDLLTPPPCLDWESVTEGLVDTPHARRQRELRFMDGDIDEVVELTRRPYRLEDLDELQALVEGYAQIPGSSRHQVLEGLRAGYWDRQVFLARLGNEQRHLGVDAQQNIDAVVAVGA